jgi:lipopolysaccharide/colanic/teichoic acid biosynthesis glycosyltransferase
MVGQSALAPSQVLNQIQEARAPEPNELPVPDQVSSASTWCLSHGKRLLDIAGATLLLALAVPLMLVVSLLIALTCGHPVTYRQVRLGLNMRPFVVFKFRTMYQDAERLTGPVFAGPNDPRITPLGRLLRRCRIDELPQLVNVLRGEMSLVGPRPERPVFIRRFMRQIPGYAGRFFIPPGLTGPAQVAESYHATAEEKLTHDLCYRDTATVWTDLGVLLRTVAVVLRANGR